MSELNPQQSEVHESTADGGGSPVAGGDARTTHDTPGQRSPETPKLQPDPPTNARIIRDDTDNGGPLVIESDDPDLNPPKAPIDPFPTNGTPEIDP